MSNDENKLLISDEQRRLISIAAGAGMEHENIAVAIGAELSELQKACAAELTTGANMERMRVIEALHASAIKGNATAARAYLANTPEPDGPPEPAPEKKVEPLGKKAQAELDAKQAQIGTTWGELLPDFSRTTH